jgi:hypothetical protein
LRMIGPVSVDRWYCEILKLGSLWTMGIFAEWAHPSVL